MLAAYEAALLGAKVALIERHLLGGRSLNYGSIPTKALLRTSRFYADMRAAAWLGASPRTPAPAEFDRIVTRAKRIRNRVGQTVSAAKLKALGVDIYFGHARFTGADSVAVDGLELRNRSTSPAWPRPASSPRPRCWSWAACRAVLS
jgi:pyruvate/2-oxoglutarate dehydrogenase complex dihydrolipoamide dehydrogenase (E3) component